MKRPASPTVVGPRTLVCSKAMVNRLGFTFTPGGLLFPYYVGVAYFLKEAGLILPTTPLGGSSAGSIVATAVACGVEQESVLAGLSRLVYDVRGGTRLNPALRKQLDILIPDDAADLAMQHNLAIGYLRVTPWPKACIATEWDSKQDLIDTVRSRLDLRPQRVPRSFGRISSGQISADGGLTRCFRSPRRCARAVAGHSSSPDGLSYGVAASSPSTASSRCRATGSAARRWWARMAHLRGGPSPSRASRGSASQPLLRAIRSSRGLPTRTRCAFPTANGSRGRSSRLRTTSWRTW